MTDPLQLSHARIDRAGEQFSLLSKEVASLLASQMEPPDIAAQLRYPQPQRPIRVCLMAGEIVYTLRAALDHIIWALVGRNGDALDGRLAFPVCDSPEDFKRVSHNGLLKGVARKYYPLIASVQPYLAPDPPNAVLKLLAELTTADLHHLLKISIARDSGEAAVVFELIGSYERAPILSVLAYIRTGVEGIVGSFKKCF